MAIAIWLSGKPQTLKNQIYFGLKSGALDVFLHTEMGRLIDSIGDYGTRQMTGTLFIFLNDVQNPAYRTVAFFILK